MSKCVQYTVPVFFFPHKDRIHAMHPSLLCTADTCIDYDHDMFRKLPDCLFQFPVLDSHNSKKPGVQQVLLGGVGMCL